MLRFGRYTQDDIELRRQLAEARILDRREIDRDQVTQLFVANAPPDAVAFVPRVPLDVALRRQGIFAFELDFEMDVRRAAGVGHRLDRAEQVLARRASYKSAEALKILVFRFGVARF